MLSISDATMASFQEAALPALRTKILQHWFETMNASGTAAGDTGRDMVLDQIAEMSRNDPDLSEADLAMVADILLVQYLNDQRQQNHAR